MNTIIDAMAAHQSMSKQAAFNMRQQSAACTARGVAPPLPGRIRPRGRPRLP
jgi:hypothetical protein